MDLDFLLNKHIDSQEKKFKKVNTYRVIKTFKSSEFIYHKGDIIQQKYPLSNVGLKLLNTQEKKAIKFSFTTPFSIDLKNQFLEFDKSIYFNESDYGRYFLALIKKSYKNIKIELEQIESTISGLIDEY